APKPAAGDSAVAQPTTGTFTDLVRARELTGDTPSRHIPLQRHAPRNKRRAPSSFVWRARRAGTLVTARSGAPLSLEIGPNFPLGITSVTPGTKRLPGVPWGLATCLIGTQQPWLAPRNSGALVACRLQLTASLAQWRTGICGTMLSAYVSLYLASIKTIDTYIQI